MKTATEGLIISLKDIKFLFHLAKFLKEKEIRSNLVELVEHAQMEYQLADLDNEQVAAKLNTMLNMAKHIKDLTNKDKQQLLVRLAEAAKKEVEADKRKELKD